VDGLVLKKPSRWSWGEANGVSLDERYSSVNGLSAASESGNWCFFENLAQNTPFFPED
jgi:hypothetical protein